ncbi:MAG: Ig-like domain-containing protein, partial [Acidobacteria bacterium]|nr:Ig-like domain-containing protein [Acidobacteriota bacterium]
MWFLAILLAVVPALGVTVRFDPSSPDTGPFPTDFLTVPDAGQRTGLRVNLPLPDCRLQRSQCRDLDFINQLDGFNLQPRIRARFSGAIRPETLREGVFFISLETGRITPINQVIYDAPTLSAYAKPDELLDQQRGYTLVITNAVRDAAGDPVDADGAFSQCLASPAPSAYCARLAAAVNALAPLLAPRRVVAASVFTTLSATAWMEKARAALQDSPLNLQISSHRGVFDVASLASVVWSQQVRANPPGFRDTSLPL